MRLTGVLSLKQVRAAAAVSFLLSFFCPHLFPFLVLVCDGLFTLSVLKS